MTPMDASAMSRWERVLLPVFMLLVVGWRVYHAPNYPYHEDEIGSIGVMRAIVETGWPLAENGTLYWRSLLGHYLMAIPLFFAEVSPVSTRLVSILFSALLLPVVYAMGNRAAGKTAGWLAVLFLGFSAFENLYASMARFYLPFQFFFVAAVYGAGEYFIARRPGAGQWLLPATLGAIGTHELAVELLPLFGLALLLGGHWRLLGKRSFQLGVALLALVGYALLVYRPAAGFANPVAIPLEMFGLPDKAAFYQWFRQVTPLGGTLLILGIYPLRREQNRLWAFYFLGFLYGLLLLTVVAPGDNPRYLSNLYPLGIVAVAASLVWWGRWLAERFRRGWRAAIPDPWVLGAVLVLAVGHLLVLENLDVAKAFGGYFRFVDQRPAHEFIRERLLPGDLVISTEPGLSAFYLGRPVDYFLREKYDAEADRYLPFSAEEKTAIRTPFIDRPERLVELLETDHRRIWLYTNWKITSTVGVAMDEAIKRLFQPRFSRNETYVLIRP